jgi:hypothetical protein
VTGRAAALAARLAALPTEADRLRAGLPELDALLRDLIRAAAPPNPQFERERIIAQAPNPRELVFLLGLLSEGENEAALLLELVAAVAAAEPDAPVAHIVDEAWYYLRTSIDAQWQLDDGEPCAAAALAYLVAVLSERLEFVEGSRPAVSMVPSAESGRAGLLRSLRDEFSFAP